MTHSLRGLSLPIIALLLAVSAAPNAFAADAMAANAMAGDAIGMMSDADLALCLEQAAAITFPDVMHAANGMMGGDAMATDAMAPAK